MGRPFAVTIPIYLTDSSGKSINSCHNGGVNGRLHEARVLRTRWAQPKPTIPVETAWCNAEPNGTTLQSPADQNAKNLPLADYRADRPVFGKLRSQCFH
jgi:hypothetical protein